jgi:hypothetical protein
MRIKALVLTLVLIGTVSAVVNNTHKNRDITPSDFSMIKELSDSTGTIADMCSRSKSIEEKNNTYHFGAVLVTWSLTK